MYARNETCLKYDPLDEGSPLTDFLHSDHSLALHCLTLPTSRTIIALMPVIFLFSLSLNVSIVQPKWYNIDSFCTPFPRRRNLRTLSSCSLIYPLTNSIRFRGREGKPDSMTYVAVLNSCTPKNTSFSGEISPISALSAS